jgi:hypothetical protein
MGYCYKHGSFTLTTDGKCPQCGSQPEFYRTSTTAATSAQEEKA